jgi:hypothetical protein
MTNPQETAECYISTWNETDPHRRLELLRTGWAADASYVDPLAGVAGTDQINTLIGGAQAQFAGFRFSLRGAPDGYGDHVRLSWALGPEGVDAPIEGSDVIVTIGDRISRVIGFLDKVPQGA